MKKIGIVTLYGNFNYGNKLQNFALQETIDKLGYEAETIILSDPSEKRKINIFDFKRIIKGVIQKFNKYRKSRELKFVKFSNDLLKVSSYKKNEGNTGYEYVGEKYNHFFVGSDQVWNPNFIIDENINFLRFAPKRKRSSYSASFGLAKIDDKYHKRYKSYFKNFYSISVREQTATNIIKKIANINVPVLLDPTFLLLEEEWIKISQPDKHKPKTKYLLTYFLHKENKKIRAMIKDIAKKHNLVIVDLGDKKKHKYYVNGPREFLDYIKDAELFFTDSFHGTVFAIIFNTPFLVTAKQESEETFSRIEDILLKFDLKERKLDDAILCSDEMFVLRVKNKNKIISEEIEKSQKFIKSSIEGK